MSLYNMVNGVNPATFFVLPVLGKHPEAYPRFRDCFLGNDDFVSGTAGKIIVMTRTGGGNREEYQSEIDEIRNMDTYEFDVDWDEDSTYALFVFSVPAQWTESVKPFFSEGKEGSISSEYEDMVCSVYPKIEDQLRQQFDNLRASET